MTRKEKVLYFIEQCWYGFLVYWFVIFMDWYTGLGLDLFRPLYISILIAFALVFTWLEIRMRKKGSTSK
ncbi:hypothetical protein [Peribacillus asahii]|uniref:hypothetical protein n=1 Tax=Peribacillus asahii TaxID=228899 RepID=UPI0038042938